MVSESELIERLREFLSTSDLDTTTTAIVRRRLEEDFSIDLSDREAFIREQLDIYIQSQFEENNKEEEANEAMVEEEVIEEEEASEDEAMVEEEVIEEEDEVEEEDEEKLTAVLIPKLRQKKRMQMVRGGPVAEAALGRLLDSTVNALNGAAARFSSNLIRLQDILRSIKPTMDDIYKFNRILKRQPHETKAFNDRLIEGEKLIEKCSKVKWWDPLGRWYYSKKLSSFEAQLLMFFQINVAAFQFRETKSISVGVSSLKEISEGKLEEKMQTRMAVTTLVVKATLGRLLHSTVNAIKEAACFSSNLIRLKTIVHSIKPTMDDIYKFNRVLKRQPHETKAFNDRLLEGEKLIEKCSKVKWWDPFSRWYYSKKLTSFEAQLLMFFQINVAAFQLRETKSISVDVSILKEKVAELAMMRNKDADLEENMDVTHEIGQFSAAAEGGIALQFTSSSAFGY